MIKKCLILSMYSKIENFSLTNSFVIFIHENLSVSIAFEILEYFLLSTNSSSWLVDII